MKTVLKAKKLGISTPELEEKIREKLLGVITDKEPEDLRDYLPLDTRENFPPGYDFKKNILYLLAKVRVHQYEQRVKYFPAYNRASEDQRFTIDFAKEQAEVALLRAEIAGDEDPKRLKGLRKSFDNLDNMILLKKVQEN